MKLTHIFWAIIFGTMLALLLIGGSAKSASFGFEDAWQVEQWGAHSYTFMVHTGYGFHQIRVENNNGGYTTGSYFCPESSCYTSWPIFSDSWEYVSRIEIFGDSWADIYGWGGY